MLEQRNQSQMKENALPRLLFMSRLNSKKSLPIVSNLNSRPIVCALAVALTFLGLLIIPYLSSSFALPQQLVSIHQLHKFFNPSSSSTASLLVSPSSSPSSSTLIEKQDEEVCANLFEGEWLFDPNALLYRNDSCAILSQAENCQHNGRPDKGYQYWRWSPRGCTLPRLDASAFLELLRGKLLAFVGDSVTRNQMESLMCILMQVEKPINRGTRKMQRWFFPKHSVTVVRLWSSWLAQVTHSEPSNLEGVVPREVPKVHVDLLDNNIAELLPRVDILVVSTGHWFDKRSVYVQGGELVGWQGWLPPTQNKQYLPKLNNVEAFAVCMKTALRAISADARYKGLTILRTYSPDHYEGGEWNSGGSCAGKVPLQDPDGNKLTKHKRDLQLAAFANVNNEQMCNATRRFSNGSTMRLLDVTLMSSYRADGHPGPFRSHKPTLPGQPPPPPQDCLHWCLPGPIDSWNHLLYHVIKQHLQQP